MTENDLILIQTSFAQRAQAQQIADIVVEKRLAACAQVAGPVHSCYRWKGRVQHEQEYILTIKAPPAHYVKLAAVISRHHPYAVPEIIAVPVCAVNDAYLNWARQQCTPA